jgi:hypothetical protein
MPTFICRNPKNYALTTDRAYEGTQEGNYITLTNDNLKVQRYHKDLFRRQPAARPAPPPPPPVPDNVQFMQTFTFSHTVGAEEVAARPVNMTLNAVINRVLITQTFDFTQAHLHISCGVSSISGINNCVNNLLRIGDNYGLDLEAKIILVTRFLQYILQNVYTGQDDFAFVLCSTTVDAFIPEIMEVFTEGSITCVEARNPNSGNQIYLWTFECDPRNNDGDEDYEEE